MPTPATRTYSRAYLHHLVKSGEILGMMLLTEINLAYYQDLMAGHAGRNRRDRAPRRFLSRETKEGWRAGDPHPEET